MSAAQRRKGTGAQRSFTTGIGDAVPLINCEISSRTWSGATRQLPSNWA